MDISEENVTRSIRRIALLKPLQMTLLYLFLKLPFHFNGKQVFKSRHLKCTYCRRLSLDSVKFLDAFSFVSSSSVWFGVVYKVNPVTEIFTDCLKDLRVMSYSVKPL